MRKDFQFGLLSSYRLRPIARSVALLVVLVYCWLAGVQNSKAQSHSDAPSPTESATSQPTEEPERTIDAQSAAGEVEIDGKTILYVYQSIGSITAKDRAEKITERILAAAKYGTSPDSVAVTVLPVWTEIAAGGKILLAVSDEDARLAGKSRAQLAADDAASIRSALIEYQRNHSWRSLFRGGIYAIVATLVLAFLLFVLAKVRGLIHNLLAGWIEKWSKSEKRTPLHIAATYVTSTLLALGSVVRWIAVIALFEVYVTVLLSFFPQTRSVSHAVTGWILDALTTLGHAVLAYLPNLFIIAIVIIIAIQVSHLITLLFSEIEKGVLSIKGFYSEWAHPTSRLVNMLVLVLTIIVIFPYLPGSKSPAFQGISIFVGVLLSLGSSSAVANAVAGVILTYMRSFSVGDWVKIGDTLGEVQEKNMLVTRVLTQKHEIITIPNATVMNGAVMNYTREANTSGVIFHTTVTIGYDAPWKTVHQLLIDAASATEHVLRNPAPFVLQTQLNDFYVAYELNVHTDNPRQMQFIYSDLHQNIQDRFNEAGVEICSPHFAALRDGNTIAIPEQYVSKDYAAPSFRVDGKDKVTQAAATSAR